MGGTATRRTLLCPALTGQQLLASIRNMVARTRDKLRRRETGFGRYDGREEDYNWHHLRLLNIVELKLLVH